MENTRIKIRIGRNKRVISYEFCKATNTVTVSSHKKQDTIINDWKKFEDLYDDDYMLSLMKHYPSDFNELGMHASLIENFIICGLWSENPNVLKINNAVVKICTHVTKIVLESGTTLELTGDHDMDAMFAY